VQVIPVDWPGDPGVGIELIGPPDSIDAAVRTLVAHGACEDVDAYEALRIEAGAPRQGYDVDETTIAQEAYLDRDAVSFTKGCFVGQELVCRIDTRGHVNRLLRRLRADVPLERGASVEVDGKAVGAVTSSAGAVGLAMLRREVEAGGSVLVRAGSGDVTARVEAIDADPGSRERVGRS
jgi:folate-binding protein YgfZ